MCDQEGLILQGCGGDLTEWVDGINGLLTEEGILLNGSKFQEVATFQNEGVTCLLFPLGDQIEVNIGKLAVWRLATHENFGGTWLSDYVDNRLGGFARDQPAQASGKPDCPLIGQDGNIFNLMGIASRTLKEHGLADQADATGSIAQKLGFTEKQDINVYIYDHQNTMQTKKYGLIAPLLNLDWYIGDNRGTDVILTSPANPGEVHDYDNSFLLIGVSLSALYLIMPYIALTTNAIGSACRK